MTQKKVILSVKTDPTTKELLSKLSDYLKVSQGELATRTITDYVQKSTDYVEYLKSLSKKHGLNLNDLIHNAVRVESNLLFQEPSLLIQKFYDSQDLWADESFEDIPIEEITVSRIENSSFAWDWELFIKQEIEYLVLNRLDAEISEILNISTDLLLTLIPSLKKMVAIEIQVQVHLFATYRPLIMAYYVELLGKIFKKTEKATFTFHHNQLSDFMEKLNEDEELLVYTIFSLLESEFNHKIPDVNKAEALLNEYFTAEETFQIFKLVKLDTIIKKAIDTPGPYSFFNK